MSDAPVTQRRHSGANSSPAWAQSTNSKSCPWAKALVSEKKRLKTKKIRTMTVLKIFINVFVFW